jgi:MFS family permease
MIVSAFFSIIAYSLIGPVPILNMELKLSTFLMGFVIFAISYTGLIIPVYAELNMIARKHGYPNDLRTQGLISGLFGAIHSLGALIGPMVGGFIVDMIGFEMATFIIVIMFFIVVSIEKIFSLKRFFNKLF